MYNWEPRENRLTLRLYGSVLTVSCQRISINSLITCPCVQVAVDSSAVFASAVVAKAWAALNQDVRLRALHICN